VLPSTEDTNLRSWRPSAPGSQPRKWSNERFSIIKITMWRMPREPLAETVVEALATARLSSSAPVTARPVEAAAIWRNLRRGSITRR
jgi:hypothetical protein